MTRRKGAAPRGVTEREKGQKGKEGLGEFETRCTRPQRYWVEGHEKENRNEESILKNPGLVAEKPEEQ